VPRCDDCKHAGDRHAERNAGMAPPDEEESVFPCLDCACGDYAPELVDV
jgi:hypothetical protein